ncbi:MAG: DUF2291 family protein [Pirellulaceae bacterium]
MTSNQKRWVFRSAVLVACFATLWFLPLFHIVPLDESDQKSMAAEAESFDPRAFVEKFWAEQLTPAATRSTDAQTLVAAIETEPEIAAETHGRRVGLSRGYYFFISGTGRVTRVDRNAIALLLHEDAGDAQVLLETGPIFGNAVRDGTGLLDINDFANSQDFNRISAEINQRIEALVLPTLRENAKVGMAVRFVGCVEITDETTDLRPLRVVPFIAEVQ